MYRSNLYHVKWQKKFIACRLFFTITNLLQILVKKPISLILFLQSSAQLLKITVSSPYQLFPLPISSWQTLNSRRMMLKWSSVNSILTADGHDIISICMVKMSGDAIIEPLFKIFKSCLRCGIFPDDWKKGNIEQVFKKRRQKNIKNYCPVSLLLICSKIFESIIYNNMLK